MSPYADPGSPYEGGIDTAPANEALEFSIIQRIWRIVWLNRFLVAGIVALCVIVAVIITLLATPQFTSTTRVQINRIEANVSDVEGVEASSSMLRYEEFYTTQYALLQSQALAERVSRTLNLPEDPEFLQEFEVPEESPIISGRPAEANEAVGRLILERIAVSPVRASALIDIELATPSPTLSARILRAWVTEFIATSVERRYAATNDARELLQNRLEELRERLEDSERELVNYSSQTGIFAVNGAGGADGTTTTSNTMIGNDLSAMNQALTQARADRIAAQSALQAGSETVNDPVATTLRAQKAQLEAERANLLTRFSPEYPPIQALDAQIASLNNDLTNTASRDRQTLQRAYDAALAREQSLQSQVRGIQSDFVTEQNALIQYNILRREVDTSRELYDGLLQRFKEIGVAGVEASNVAIVDPPTVPTSRSSPNLFFNLLLALVAGAVFSGIVLFIKEQIDRSLRDPVDVRDILGIPLLGAIPRRPSETLLEEISDPKSEVAEAYLSIATLLDLATPEGVPKRLLLTSAGPNEGKSSSSYAIARQLAKRGKRIALVDLDLRNPSLGKMLDLKEKRGMSSLITGHDTLDSGLIHEIEPNLFVVLTGPKPPNPGDLISSERTQEIINELATRFDHVVIDAAPILGLADAPVLSSRVDAVVLIIEANRARLRQLSRAIDRVHNMSGNVIGGVVTKLDSRNADYGYGYGYGYGFGYGYGDDEPVAARS